MQKDDGNIIGEQAVPWNNRACMMLHVAEIRDHAGDLGAIPCEVPTGISQRVKRVYVHG